MFQQLSNHKPIITRLFQMASRIGQSPKFAWGLIGFGVLLRLLQYLANRSLWLDEARLVLNIVNRSFIELLQPLDYSQGAPIGFLMLAKLSVCAFGNNEYALRLIPLLFGIIALPLFHAVAKRCLKPKAVPIALGLFAISDSLIYYSSEAKQYAVDVAVALLLSLLAIACLDRKRLTMPSIMLLGVTGAAAIWFSHPATFVLAGVGLVLIFFSLGKNKGEKIGRLSIVFLLWATSFVVSYFIILRNLSHNALLLNYWDGGFMPFPPSSLSDIKWFIHTFFAIFENPVGLSFSGLAALVFLVGCRAHWEESKPQFMILAAPIFFALIASALHKYPFSGRMLLFAVPAALLFIAAGVEKVSEQTARYSMIGITLVGLLFFHPLWSASNAIVKPRTNEEIRPVMIYLMEHWQNDDGLYLYHNAAHPFQYYAKRYGFDRNNYIIGVNSRHNWKSYFDDLDKLLGNKRVWILFSHVYNWDSIDEEKLFLFHLDRIGTRLDAYASDGAAVYLYDLSLQASPLSTRLE
jgi:hypothetical protein